MTNNCNQSSESATQICNCCGESKILSDFRLYNIKTKPTYTKKCKDCSKKTRENNIKTKESSMTHKDCKICKKNLELFEFDPGRNVCLMCRKNQVIARQKNPEDFEKMEKDVEKKCDTCHISKSLCDFERTGVSHRNTCISCRKMRRKEAPVEDKEVIIAKVVGKTKECKECKECGETKEIIGNFQIHTNFYRNICNECYNKKDYCKTYREKKKKEIGEEQYLKNKAEHARMYRAKREIEGWVKTFDSRFFSIKGGAKSRGIGFFLSKSECEKMMLINPCYYCGITIEDKINGIDRLDHNDHYTPENCVSCCTDCNMMKGSLDPNTFIERCSQISYIHSNTIGSLNLECWIESRPVDFNQYKIRAKKKNLVFELTEEDYESFTNNKCFYCGLMLGLSGIDRKNNSFGYTSSNCVSCCSQCNQSKKAMRCEDFIDKCIRITKYIKDNSITFPELLRVYNVLSKRNLTPIANNFVVKEMSQEDRKDYLRNVIVNMYKNYTYNDLVISKKNDQLFSLLPNQDYDNLVFSLEDWSKIDLQISLEFCETKVQKEMYQYYRDKFSSLPFTGLVGKQIKILVKDQKTGKYLGVLCLSSPVFGMFDKFIPDKEWMNKYMMDISCCVPFQPFGNRCKGGKLLASLAFSKEVSEYYTKKYSNEKYVSKLLVLGTSGINGKGVMYDRLNCLKFVNLSSGYGTIHLPDKVYELFKEYNKDFKIVKPSMRKMFFMSAMLGHIGIKEDILRHNQLRGIFLGSPFVNKKDIQSIVSNTKRLTNEKFSQQKMISFGSIEPEGKKLLKNLETIGRDTRKEKKILKELYILGQKTPEGIEILEEIEKIGLDTSERLKTSKELLGKIVYDKSKLLSIQEISDSWVERWCKNRCTRKNSNIQRYKPHNPYHLPDGQITEGIIIKKILAYKPQKITCYEIPTLLYEDCNIKVAPDYVMKVLNGERKPKVVDEEYIKMFSTGHKKSNGKFNNEHKAYVALNKNVKNSVLKKNFLEKFGFSISETSIRRFSHYTQD
jgi:uncharacterized protein DUF4338